MSSVCFLCLPHDIQGQMPVEYRTHKLGSKSCAAEVIQRIPVAHTTLNPINTVRTSRCDGLS